ncbi:MAG: hypothetical protein LC117_09115 [Bacteroidia bacterium]|nr:hypothetical protein [Bacteroidia bacterium]MCZ2278072.1 hypothetical protein [Bacteroidia bacterium]
MKLLKIIHTFLLACLGAVSVFMTLSVIFNLFGIREIEGNYVLFVVYSNLVCGIIYLCAAIANWKNLTFSFYIMVLASLILIVTFIFFGVYITGGGIYEAKTVKAMTFRTIFTVVMAVVSFILLRRASGKK